MDTAARDLLRAMNNRNNYRKRPPHDIIELQDKVREVQGRLAQHRNAVRASWQIRRPQRTNVTRFQNKSVLELTFPEIQQNKILVVRRQTDLHPRYAKFWDVMANKPIYVDKNTMRIAWGDLEGERVRINEHWTSSGLRR